MSSFSSYLILSYSSFFRQPTTTTMKPLTSTCASLACYLTYYFDAPFCLKSLFPTFNLSMTRVTQSDIDDFIIRIEENDEELGSKTEVKHVKTNYECSLCSIPFPSHKHYDDHLSSQIHTTQIKSIFEYVPNYINYFKSINYIEETALTPEKYLFEMCGEDPLHICKLSLYVHCYICNSDCKTHEQFIKHRVGLNHTRRVKGMVNFINQFFLN